MKSEKLLVIGCGILKNEVRFLAEKNNWAIDSIFLDSTHHCDFSKLAGGLRDEIKKNQDRNMFILYGACHPLMDQLLDKAGTFRVEGQNCIEMLLTREIFMEKLLEGCFFLLEDWAVRWEYLLSRTYPRCRPEIMREIFKTDRKYILALRTPGSGDFSLQAQKAAAQMQVPLKWMDVSLNHFEELLKNAIKKGQRNPNERPDS
jgi:hypothetical protein